MMPVTARPAKVADQPGARGLHLVAAEPEDVDARLARP